MTELTKPDFEVAVTYMSARRLGPYTSDYLMIGFEFEGKFRPSQFFPKNDFTKALRAILWYYGVFHVDYT